MIILLIKLLNKIRVDDIYNDGEKLLRQDLLLNLPKIIQKMPYVWREWKFYENE